MGYDDMCPYCGGKTVAMCRCSSRVLPHTLEQIQKGHGHECENGHRWGGDIVVDAETGAVLEERKRPMKTTEILEKAGSDKWAKFGRFSEVAKLTDDNNHTESVMVAEKLVGEKRVEKIAEHIEAIRKLENDMPDGLYEYRNALRKRLLAFAKKKLSQEEYRQLGAAF